LGKGVRNLEGDNLIMIDGIPINDLTAPSLLGIAIVLILLGWLVPRSTLKDKKEESEKWQQAYEAERKARSLSDAQTAELLELARTSKHLLESFFGENERVPLYGGGRHAAPVVEK
jgi:hypothetical protein